MTIKQARRILGTRSIKLSDEEIEADIMVATFLKILFFDQLLKKEGVIN